MVSGKQTNKQKEDTHTHTKKKQVKTTAKRVNSGKLWSEHFEEEKIDNSGRKHEWIWILSLIQGRKAGAVTKSCSKFVTMALITKIAKNRTQDPQSR